MWCLHTSIALCFEHIVHSSWCCLLLPLTVKELQAVHDKHLNRPTLDDNIEEEHIIEIQTQEITQVGPHLDQLHYVLLLGWWLLSSFALSPLQMFMRCQRLVQQISSKSRVGSQQEQKLTGNIVSSIARTLQDLSTTFRKAQSSYLKSKSTHLGQPQWRRYSVLWTYSFQSWRWERRDQSITLKLT